MSPATAAIEIVALAAVTGGLAQAALPEAQNWTILSLLAAVVLGVGYGLVKSLDKSGDKTAAAIEKSNDRVVAALDKHAEAQTQVGTNLALLIRESQEARDEGEEKRRQILEKLEHVPERVAERLRK